MKHAKRHCIIILCIACILISGVPLRDAGGCFAAQTTAVQEAIRQTAYSYYMRGMNIQYNSMKGNPSCFAPEEATPQNMTYCVCSSFIFNVYYNSLGIKIPPYTDSQLKYAEQNAGKPEVVLFGKTDAEGKKQMQVYDQASGKLRQYTDMTTDELLPYLAVGDILTYTGHTMLVYEIVRNEQGKAIDAVVMGSGHGNKGKHVVIKTGKKTNIGSDISFGSGNAALYLNGRINTRMKEGQTEGSLHLSTLKTVGVWKDLAKNNKEKYSVLRFLTEENGVPILTYHGKKYADEDYNGVPVELPQHTLDRIRFPKLYIEKTADVFAGGTVGIGEDLTYRITIKNESAVDYTDEILVTETVSPFVRYKSYHSGKTKKKKKNADTGALHWNIGRLAAGETVDIAYTVAVKDDSIWRTITSTGSVASIPSAVVKHFVQWNIPDTFTQDFASQFEALKLQYTGKTLINEIYQAVTGLNLGFDRFDIRQLITDTNPSSILPNTIVLNQDNDYCSAVLNHYWGAMS